MSSTCCGRSSSRPSPTGIYRARELVAHGSGWVERIVADQPDVSTYFTPIAITINVDSFEHLEFETRPDQLLVYTLVQGDERVVIEFVPTVGEDERRPSRPSSSSSTPAGSSRWSSWAWRDPRSRGATAPRERAAVAERWPRGVPDGYEGAQSEGGSRHRMSAIAQLLQVRRARHEPRDRGASRPDHVHGHGLHHLPEPDHPDWPGSGTRTPRFTAVALSAGTALVAGIMTIAMGVVGNYPLALAAGPRHQRDRRVLADRPRPVARRARWA